MPTVLKDGGGSAMGVGTLCNPGPRAGQGESLQTLLQALLYCNATWGPVRSARTADRARCRPPCSWQRRRGAPPPPPLPPPAAAAAVVARAPSPPAGSPSPAICFGTRGATSAPGKLH